MTMDYDDYYKHGKDWASERLLRAIFGRPRTTANPGGLVSIKMKDSTPNFSVQGLCISCSHSHIVKGSSFKEHFVLCHAMYEGVREIKFKVHECNRYADMNEMPLHKMEKLAHIMVMDKKQGFMGFIPAKQFREMNKLKRDTPLTEEDD